MATTERRAFTQEVATIARDPRQPVYGGLIHPEDDTLMARGQGRGLKIYDDLERDCHVFAVLQKRKMAPVSREWMVEPASETSRDRAAADLVRRHLEALPFDRICVGLLDALLKGFAVAEVIWGFAGREIVPLRVLPRDQRRFVFDVAARLRLLTPEEPARGIELPERKFIVHSCGAKDGNPYGLGLGTRLFWPVYFKRQGVTFWLVFADKFGNPTAMGKYPNGSSQADKDTLMAALRALSHDTGVSIPEGMDIQLLEAQRSGTVNTYETLLRWCDTQISEAVLGETLTTNIGEAGSRAASQTHNEVREELARADGDLLSNTLNETLVRWIVELNLPGAAPPRIWRNFDEEEDLNQRSQRDGRIAALGFRPTPQYILETYGEGWETVKNPPPGGAPGEGGAPAFAETTGGDAIDRAVEEAMADWEPLMAPMIEPLMTAMEKAIADGASLEEFRDRMGELLAEMDSSALADRLSRLAVGAHLAGQAGAPILEAEIPGGDHGGR